MFRGRSILQFGWNISIREPDVIELDATGAFDFFRMRWGDDLNLGVEQFEDAFGGSHGRLENVVFLTQILNRPKEALRILHERYQHAKGCDSAQRLIAAEPDHHRDRERR